jgi:hypothetical protein
MHLCEPTPLELLLECTLLKEDRERLIAAVAKTDNWPVNKDTLIKKHFKAFAKFMERINKITEINTENRTKHSGQQ